MGKVEFFNVLYSDWLAKENGSVELMRRVSIFDISAGAHGPAAYALVADVNFDGFDVLSPDDVRAWLEGGGGEE